MKCQPNCKINLGLFVTEKRPDGYHNLETVFVPVSLSDTLEMTPSTTFQYHQDGIPISGTPEDNLVVKAYRLLQEEFPQVGPMKITLTKNIPFGAGLGGGSSDAAFALKMVNQIYQLSLTTAQLEERAAKLGADCAFFISNQIAFAQGIGNELQPLPGNITLPQHLLLVKPQDFVSTGEAYRNIHPKKAPVKLPAALQLPVDRWQETILNDFENSVFPHHPRIQEAKELLLKEGALYASMSGSGSTVYGFMPQEPNLEHIRKQLPDCQCYSVKVLQ